jgi:hypothetical protein
MTDEEKVERVLQILDETNLEWVATQVREHIRTGRTTIRPEPVSLTRSPPVDTDGQEDADQLPPKDALEVARQALSIVIVDLPAMETESYEFFRVRIDKLSGIAFAAEPMDDATPFRLEQPEAAKEGHRQKVKLAVTRLTTSGTDGGD